MRTQGRKARPDRVGEMDRHTRLQAQSYETATQSSTLPQLADADALSAEIAE